MSTTLDPRELVAALTTSGKWMSADILAKSLGQSERGIRALASAARPHVISGQNGYRATSCASAAEIQHFAAWMRSQANEMRDRADATERHYNNMTALRDQPELAL